jgi:hypothetical protein
MGQVIGMYYNSNVEVQVIDIHLFDQFPESLVCVGVGNRHLSVQLAKYKLAV